MFYRRIDDHLALKLFNVYDAAEIFDLIERDRDHLSEFLPWVGSIRSVEDERASLKLLGVFDPDQQVNCSLTRDDRIIGAVGLPMVNREADWGEIGYWISRSEQGKGYVTAAVREVERLAFLDIGLDRVQITCDIDNIRSSAIPRRLGYTMEGILRHHLVSGGFRIADRAVYSLLRGEWEAREAPAVATGVDLTSEPPAVLGVESSTG